MNFVERKRFRGGERWQVVIKLRDEYWWTGRFVSAGIEVRVVVEEVKQRFGSI
jgi:hypothetical protein